MPPKPTHAVVAVRESRAHTASAEPTGDILPATLPADALDDRIAIVGTAVSGKTYAAKGFVERLFENGAHVTIVDPLGVWWGLRER
jgi:polynucleotide 5'-kinase involved in rRNA processing